MPEELKTNIKKGKKLGIRPEQLIHLIPLAFGILISVHIYLSAAGVIKHYRYNALDKKWKKLQPEREMLNNFKSQYDVLSSNTQAIQQLNSRRLTWSEKLNKLSLDLPSGIWFNEILVSPAELVVKASVISLQKEELGLINKFIDNLKNDAGFFRDFNNLELSSIQRRLIGGYDIVDFILTGKLKSR